MPFRLLRSWPKRWRQHCSDSDSIVTVHHVDIDSVDASQHDDFWSIFSGGVMLWCRQWLWLFRGRICVNGLIAIDNRRVDSHGWTRLFRHSR